MRCCGKRPAISPMASERQHEGVPPGGRSSGLCVYAGRVVAVKTAADFKNHPLLNHYGPSTEH